MLSREEINILVSIPRLTASLFMSGKNIHNPRVESDIHDIWRSFRHRLPSFPRMKDGQLICYGVFVTEEYGGHALPLSSQYFQGDIGIFYDEVKIFLHGNEEATMVDVVFIDTLRTIFFDDRFPNNPLRFSGDLSEAFFSIDLLDKEFPISPDRFWKVYEPCQMGITLQYKGRQATFLPSVMKRWLSDCQVTKRIDFEREVFSALFDKMGMNVSWEEWKKGIISLYHGYEFAEIDNDKKYFFY